MTEDLPTTEPSPNASVNETWYSRVFARVYDPFMQRMEERVLSRHRSRMIGALSGDVLEVGAGTGINFQYYPSGCRVIASEPSAQMLRFATDRLNAVDAMADIRLVQAGVGSPGLARLIPADGLDAIVCTLVLCTVPDPVAAIRSFRQWLKPDGRLIVIEHVHGSAQPRRSVHEFLNPAWKVLAEGCHLTRDTPRLLRDGGFVPVEEVRFVKVVPFYIATLRPDGQPTTK